MAVARSQRPCLGYSFGGTVCFRVMFVARDLAWDTHTASRLFPYHDRYEAYDSLGSSLRFRARISSEHALPTSTVTKLGGICIWCCRYLEINLFKTADNPTCHLGKTPDVPPWKNTR